MKKKVYNKLIRDKIPQIIEKNGLKSKISKLNDRQYDLSLRKKLLEETVEVKNAKTKEELLNELSDVTEIVKCIAKNHNITAKNIEKHRRKKIAEKGGFEKKLFLKYIYKD